MVGYDERRFILGERSVRGMTAVVGDDAAQNGEAGDQGFEKCPNPGWVDWSHCATVGRRDARVVREIEEFGYEFVATDALSRGGVLRVWKTTQ